jgi:hypothetical protein
MNDFLTTSENWKKNLGLGNVNKGQKRHKDNHKWCLETNLKKLVH